MDQVAFFIVGRLLAERLGGKGFFEVVVCLALGEEAFFSWRGGLEGSNCYRPFGRRVQRYLHSS